MGFVEFGRKVALVLFPPWLVWLVGAGLALGAGACWRRWRRAQLAARRQLAMLELDDCRESLVAEFLRAAEATGKPRGLRWKSCAFHDGALFATDRVTGQLYALVGATVGFEAVAGGPMEDVEAVDKLRCVTAVLAHRHGAWTSDGRAVFNHEPQQALERYAESLAPVN